MRYLKQKNEFAQFYKEEKVVNQYDKERLKTSKKRVKRKLELYFFVKDLPQNKNVLEIGSGTGFLTKVLVKHSRLVTAVDISENMLEFLRKKIHSSKLKIKQGSIFDLKKIFKDQSFDVVVSMRVLIHLNHKDVLTSIKQMSSVGSNNLVVIFDLPANSFTNKLMYRLKSLLLRLKNKEEVANFMYSKKNIEDILKDTDLEIINLYAIDHLLLFMPLYLVLYLVSFKKLERLIFNVETKLGSFNFFNNKWVIVCRKKQ